MLANFRCIRRLRMTGMAFAVVLAFGASFVEADTFQVNPVEITLQGNLARTQAVVTKLDETGKVTDRSDDLTTTSTFASSDHKIFSVNQEGELLAVSNGSAKLVVTNAGVAKEVNVQVSGVAEKPNVQFLEHISPVLTRLGCNQGACHASQHGKGGFVLSVFNFEPEKDRDMMARDRDQRRIDFINPERSLFLLKQTMKVAHGGGKRLQEGSVDYQLLVAWIRGGAPKPRADAPTVAAVKVWPTQRLGDIGLQQQLRVEATYSNGETRDVTAWARFDSMDDGVVQVTPKGLCKTIGRGQAPVMVRFEGQAAISVFVVPFGPSPQLAGWTNHNFIDELASQKFRELGIEPSPVCDDTTFLRRAFLDAIGTMPTVEESLAFIQS